MPSGVYKRKPFTEEHRKNIGKTRNAKGKHWKLSDETKRRMRVPHKGSGIYKRTPEHKKITSDAMKEKGIKPTVIVRGESHYNWKGGISKNKEHLKKLSKMWVERNYGKKLWFNRQRRVFKQGNGGSHTLQEWETLKTQYDWTCPCCRRKEPMIILTLDHIIPISKGGSDNIENIQPLCKTCNSKKNNRIITKY